MNAPGGITGTGMHGCIIGTTAVKSPATTALALRVRSGPACDAVGRKTRAKIALARAKLRETEAVATDELLRTDPQIAAVGMTDAEARTAGLTPQVTSLPHFT
jgi:hypothetical protein